MDTYKGQLKDFPNDIVERMLECQVLQGNRKNISIFEADRSTGRRDGGFQWDSTDEGHGFWANVIQNKRFNTYFDKYPAKAVPLEPLINEVSELILQL